MENYGDVAIQQRIKVVIKRNTGITLQRLACDLLGVRERLHSQPHLVASLGGREKITHLGAKQTKTVSALESTYF